VLNFLGFPAEKCAMADTYLPQSAKWYGADPDEVYMGNPRLDDGSPECGYYCFAGPLLKAANAYFEDLGDTRYIPVDLTGCGQAELEAELQAGRPFIFWASLHFGDIGFDPCGGYALPGGKYHTVFHTLHCMVCKGMDDEAFYIADPLNFNERVEKQQFMKIFRQLGSRAVVLRLRANS